MNLSSDHTLVRQSRTSVGVVAICKNEYRDLPGFLSCLLPWVDEIIVVDDGSTDDSVAVCKNSGSKVTVIQANQVEKDYAALRNLGIDSAESEWLLHMDIDERITPELAAEIQTAIETRSFDAYRYRRLNYFLHRPFPYGGWQRWNHVQLARRKIGRFHNRVHEILHIDAPTERIGQLKHEMHHLNDETFAERLGKNIHYSHLEAMKMIGQGKRIRFYHFVARPLYRFLKSYLWEGACLGGTHGLLFSIYTMSSTFNWYATAYDMQTHINRHELDRALLRKWDLENHKTAD